MSAICLSLAFILALGNEAGAEVIVYENIIWYNSVSNGLTIYKKDEDEDRWCDSSGNHRHA